MATSAKSRRAKPAAIKLLEGKEPGRDSAGAKSPALTVPAPAVGAAGDSDRRSSSGMEAHGARAVPARAAQADRPRMIGSVTADETGRRVGGHLAKAGPMLADL